MPGLIQIQFGIITVNLKKQSRARLVVIGFVVWESADYVMSQVLLFEFKKSVTKWTANENLRFPYVRSLISQWLSRCKTFILEITYSIVVAFRCNKIYLYLYTFDGLFIK